jgi:ribosomal protein L34E
MKTKVEKLYENPKSKGFVNHLIRSYLPVGKIKKIWEWEKNKKPVCNVCGQKLVSVGELMAAIQKPEFMENFMDNMKKQVNGEAIKREDNPYLKAVGTDKLQGYTGVKTDTCMCPRCCGDLLDMVTNGMLHGDNNINYQVNQMQRDAAFKPMFDSPAIDDEAKEKLKEIKKRVDKDKKITTFGDLQALQDLKKKMEEK